MTNSAIGIGLLVLAGVLIVLPPRWDPAIRLKEWLERRSDDDRHSK